MEDVPKVSICMPILNAGIYLRERMDTIMAQTLTDWELIVSDNFSDDGSWEFLQEYASDPRIVLFQTPREGMYQNWNVCLSRVRGEFVYIATADDTMSPDFLEKMVGALQKAEKRKQKVKDEGWQGSKRNIDLAICRYDRIDEKGKRLEYKRSGIDEFLEEWGDIAHIRNGLSEFLIMMCVECQWDTLTAVVFRSRILAKTGLFRTDCGNAADRVWRWKAVLHSDIVYVPEYLATWRTHAEQSTAKTLVDPEHTHLVYQLASETIDECESLVPEGWKKHGDWKEKLLHHFWVEYVRGYGLDRKMLRAEPLQFFKGIFRALVHEPRYFHHRLVSGLSWDDPLFEDEVVRLKRLIKEWDAPWPPVRLDN